MPVSAATAPKSELTAEEIGKLDAVLRAVQQNAQKPVDMPNDKTKDQ